MKFILILTIVVSSINGDGAGLSTAEFDSLEKCEKAGETWYAKAVEPLGYNSQSKSSYICVEK